MARWWLPLVFMLVTACGSGSGGSSNSSITPNPTPPAASPPESVQEAVDAGVSSGVTGMFYYVETGNGTRSIGASGLQDRVNSEQADAASLFKIASISKLFLATATSKLAYQNILSLDDTIEYWLPAIAPRIENADTISVRLLVQHRSGVPDFDNQSGFSWEDAHTDIDNTLAYALDKPADFLPNARYEYSNTNYLLLARILDAALGYSHHIYIQDFILTPLGMNDTSLLLADVDQSRLVHGYWDGRDVTSQDYVIPGGSMISTVSDIGIFLRELAEGDLLNDDERTIYRQLYSFGHSGWLPGYQSIARYEADIDSVVVLFANNTGGVSESVIASTYDRMLQVLR